MADNSNNKGKELDDLLDDALKDFTKTEAKNDDSASGSLEPNASGDAPPASDSEAFFLEQAQLLADRMNNLFGGPNTPSGDQDPDQILTGFKKMAEAAAMTLQGENTASAEEVAKYSESIAQALKGLNEGSDNLASPALDADVANMFNSLGLGESTEGEAGNTFLPFMEGMMQSLLSAEVLLPSIKELVEKYPQYLEENSDKLPAEDKERYEKQLELYKIIQGHLENERADDSAAVKREKFRVVLDDMRKLQDYGQPPAEILEQTAGDLPVLDPNGGFDAAAAGAGNPQCPMM